MIDLSIIIVSWNVRNELKKCLKSIHDCIEGLNIEIYVVDNNSSDGTCEMIEKKFLDVNLIENKNNVGFAAANNQAMLHSSGRYVLLLNPDTVIYPNAFENMCRFMDTNSKVAACTCKILDDKNRIFRFRTKELTIKDELLRDTIIGKLASPFRKRSKNIDFDKTQKVNRIPGSCMMVRRETVEKIGMLDERYFLYVEDDDWCRRINKVGEIYYVANATIKHLAGKSSEQVRADAWCIGTNSRLMFYEKYYGFLLTLLLRGAILSSAAISLLKWKGIYLLGKKGKVTHEKLLFYQSSMQGCLSLRKKLV
jgi:GT2 family glycosyltransferase